MPTKTTKKSTTKATTAKKPVAKKVAQTKKEKVVKSATKSAPKAVKAANVAAPCMEQMHCKCGANCHCGDNCNCGANCKCGGGKFGRFVKKFIIALILLALGFAAAKICCCDKGMRGPRVVFADNGCMVEESVKCPKMMEMLPAMDINQDGCITRDEFREFKHQMRERANDTAVVADENVEVSVDAE